MKTKIILWLILLLTGFSSAYTRSDNENLILRGRYGEWKKVSLESLDPRTLDYYNDYSREYHFGLNDQKINENDFLWVAELRMEFVNVGAKPVILVAPKQEFGGFKTAVFLSTQKNIESDENIDAGLLKKFERKSEGMSAKEIDTEKPPENVAIVIEPGDSWHFNDFLQIFQKAGDTPPISSQSIVKIKYKLSFLKFQKDTEFFEKIQSRWQKFGHLPVNENGEFSITSEVLTRG